MFYELFEFARRTGDWSRVVFFVFSKYAFTTVVRRFCEILRQPTEMYRTFSKIEIYKLAVLFLLKIGVNIWFLLFSLVKKETKKSTLNFAEG